MPSFAVVRAVLDACVLYPMYLRDTLLRTAEAGFYQPYWSADILAEVRRNIVTDGHALPENADRLLNLLRMAFPSAEVVGYQSLVGSMLNDPKDRHVTAAAVTCQARLIVTDNLADFPPSALDPFNLTAQSADAFLTDIFLQDEEAVAQTITVQAAAYNRPPMTASELLDRLAKRVPEFARSVQSYLSK